MIEMMDGKPLQLYPINILARHLVEGPAYFKALLLVSLPVQLLAVLLVASEIPAAVNTVTSIATLQPNVVRASAGELLESNQEFCTGNSCVGPQVDMVIITPAPFWTLQLVCWVCPSLVLCIVLIREYSPLSGRYDLAQNQVLL
jgi:hypothetical protein